jgi:hypothetical protein
MNQKYSNVLALELAIYQVHEPAYNPVKKIIEFWNKYDINTIQNTINLLLKKTAGRSPEVIVLEFCHQLVFAVGLGAVRLP